MIPGTHLHFPFIMACLRFFCLSCSSRRASGWKWQQSSKISRCNCGFFSSPFMTRNMEYIQRLKAFTELGHSLTQMLTYHFQNWNRKGSHTLVHPQVRGGIRGTGVLGLAPQLFSRNMGDGADKLILKNVLSLPACLTSSGLNTSIFSSKSIASEFAFLNKVSKGTFGNKCAEFRT